MLVTDFTTLRTKKTALRTYRLHLKETLDTIKSERNKQASLEEVKDMFIDTYAMDTIWRIIKFFFK